MIIDVPMICSSARSTSTKTYWRSRGSLISPVKLLCERLTISWISSRSSGRFTEFEVSRDAQHLGLITEGGGANLEGGHAGSERTRRFTPGPARAGEFQGATIPFRQPEQQALVQV